MASNATVSGLAVSGQPVSGQAALSIPAVCIAMPAGQRRSCSAVGRPGSGLTGLLPLALTGAS